MTSVSAIDAKARLAQDESRRVRLSEVADVSAGGSAPQGEEYFGGTNPFVRVQHLDESRSQIRRWDLITDQAVKDYRLRLFPRGTILLPKSGASIRLEKRAVLPVDAYVVSHLATIAPRPEVIDSGFLFYALRATRLADSKADGYPTLALSEIRDTEIPLPPRDLQIAVSGALSSIERALGVSAHVLDATRKLRLALHRHLFSYGVGPVTRPMRSTELGSLPAEWELLSFRELLAEPLRNGHSAPSSGSESGVRTLTLTAVTRNDFSIANTKVTSADPSKVRDLWLEPGDILIERSNTKELVGTAALYDGPRGFAIYPDLVIRARVRTDRVSPRFIAEFLQTPACRDYFTRNARGAAGNMPKIGHGVIDRLLVPVPDLREQEAIAEALAASSRKIRSEHERELAIERLFFAALRELIGKRPSELTA